jgi:5-methylcytosine-specific restriction endonuclease McrA
MDAMGDDTMRPPGRGQADVTICRSAGDDEPADGRTGGTPVRFREVLRLLEQQRFRCAMTGRALTPPDAALDHKEPISRGGRHCMENVQVLHEQVNRAKGTMSNSEFLALCREVVEWADRPVEA